jgi:hypothetical protein
MAVTAPTLDRPAALRRARALNSLTIGWNAVEGVVAVAAGIAAGSVSVGVSASIPASRCRRP